MSQYDLAIVGAGPAGYTAALRAAHLGKRVALIERDELGGVCLNRGCIPTKALAASAKRLKLCGDARDFGVIIDGEPRLDFARVQERKCEVVEGLRKGVQGLLKAAGVEVLRGEACLKGTGEIAVGDDAVKAERIIIASGSRWIDLPNLVCDGERIVTSDDALLWDAVPQSVCIVGGGYIGCEFASILSGCGATVTIVEATERILPFVDRTIAKELARAFARRAIMIKTGTTVDSASPTRSGMRVTCSDGETIECACILVAVGRRPYADDLGLSNAGVELNERGAINVNERFETKVPGVYAIGDVTGGVMLAHVASEQAIACVEAMFGESAPFDGRCIPACIFTEPEVAYVGATADELEHRGTTYATGRFGFAALGKAVVDGAPEGQVIVYAGEGGRLLGVHMIGAGATEMVAEATLALKAGLTSHDLAQTIHAHPTRAEALAEAARDSYGAAIHKAARRPRRA